MARYLLSAHSYVCVADEYAVFLDLKKDKYSALEPADARSLSGKVEGWFISPGSEVAPSEPAQGCELVRALLEEEILTEDERTGKTVAAPSLARANITLARPPRTIPCVGGSHLGHFAAAWLITAAMLRVLPLRITVERVRRRKARRHLLAGTFDIQKVLDLMTAYFILRPNFFSSMDACLRDSLTVIEFLAGYGVFPTWVFGVRMNPFTAHSWVQEGTVVLNDTVEHVNTFNPIMTI